MSERSPITTHVLDTTIGRPAAGIRVVLERLDGATAQEIASGRTDGDGRVSDFLPPGSLEPGTFRLTFDVADYLAAQNRETFYPHVPIVFRVDAADEHYHVPLLLNPFGYTTYRGS
ncbi:MAG: hydroxyisourate hydrolase [Planctomycetes bacterium]|nr:hydroxyisourate hydrolase [Planctomycetota bacterium]